MSVEKSEPFNPSISYEVVPYTQVYTHVIQNIKNMEAGFVWMYLLSKPKDWTVIKEHLKNHFNIGDDKIKQIFSYLAKHRLLEYIKHRDELGKIIKVDIRILKGDKFLTDQELEELSTEEPPTGVKTHRVASHTCGSRALHIIENTNERKKIKTIEKKSVDNFKNNYEKPKPEYNRCENQSTSYQPCPIPKGSVHVEEQYMSQMMNKILGKQAYHQRILNNNENNEVKNDSCST